MRTSYFFVSGTLLFFKSKIIAYGGGVLTSLNLLISFAPAHAQITYDGSQGVYQQVFSPFCIECHTANGPFPRLNRYSFAKLSIDEIIRHTNLSKSDTQSMPKNGSNLAPPLLNMLQQWKADGTPETSAPQMLVTNVDQIAQISVILAGTVKENGHETAVKFKYWRSDHSEPTACPATNSLLAGCTIETSPAGSGGNDIAQPYSHHVDRLNCGTSYSYRAMSAPNGYYPVAVESSNSVSFTTLASIYDTDMDGICNAADNCLDKANPVQEDVNGDGTGDACESSLCFPVKIAAQKLSIIYL